MRLQREIQGRDQEIQARDLEISRLKDQLVKSSRDHQVGQRLFFLPKLSYSNPIPQLSRDQDINEVQLRLQREVQTRDTELQSRDAEIQNLRDMMERWQRDLKVSGFCESWCFWRLKREEVNSFREHFYTTE